VRIIRGKLRSRRFSIPKNFPSRPTTDFAKEGLFNILDNNYDIDDFDILDLCAGTGNISFEFLSREAGRVTAVDRDFNCIKFIQKTAKEFKIDDDLITIKSDILQFIKKSSKKYDLIFADPPYTYEQYPDIVLLIFEHELLKKDGLLIVEHGKTTDLSALPHFEKTRILGNVHFSFFEYSTTEN
jgi:16S rRNA (guanine966-N2)-methyltransferase